MRLGFLHPVDADRALPRLADAHRGDRAGSRGLRLCADGLARDARTPAASRALRKLVFGAAAHRAHADLSMVDGRAGGSSRSPASASCSPRPTRCWRACRNPRWRGWPICSTSMKPFIAASEEFDQYPGRTGARYWGAVANLDKGVSPPWPMVGAKRVFAYLKPNYGDFEKMLKALRTHRRRGGDSRSRRVRECGSQSHRGERGVLRRPRADGRCPARMRSRESATPA